MPNASIVCSRLSSNALGRSYVLSQLTRQAGFTSKIVGLVNGAGIWHPFRTSSAIPIHSDIRITLNGAGWIVNPANAVNLAEAVIEALTDQDLAAQRGMMARDRFLTHYTIDALTRIFASIKEVSELLARIS